MTSSGPGDSTSTSSMERGFPTSRCTTALAFRDILTNSSSENGGRRTLPAFGTQRFGAKACLLHAEAARFIEVAPGVFVPTRDRLDPGLGEKGRLSIRIDPFERVGEV